MKLLPFDEKIAKLRAKQMRSEAPKRRLIDAEREGRLELRRLTESNRSRRSALKKLADHDGWKNLPPGFLFEIELREKAQRSYRPPRTRRDYEV